METQPSSPPPGDAWSPKQSICPLGGPSMFARRDLPSRTNADNRPAATRPELRGIIFEPANVFYDDTLWRRWLLRVLTRMGLHTHYHVFFEVWQSEYVPRVHRGEVTFTNVLREFLAASGFVSRQIEELLAATKAKRMEFEHEHRLLPHVATTLHALHQQGMTMVVAADSAFTADEITNKLDRLGLSGYFQGVTSSRDLGVTKPREQCYQAAVELTGLTASQLAFVSCHPTHLVGAQEFGLWAVSNRSETADDSIATIGRIDELLDLIPADFSKRLAG